MVDDDVCVALARKGIRCLFRFVAQSESKEADNHVIRADNCFITADADALARGGLSRDGKIAVFDFQACGETDMPRHFEKDNPGPFALYCPTQGPLLSRIF